VRFAVALMLASLAGCSRGGVHVLAQPSQGRAASCPPAPVAVGDGLGGGDAIRCSYDDALGSGVTSISGQVRADDGGLGVAMEGVEVAIYAAGPPGDADGAGPPLGSARTDPQGGFRFSAILEAGDYVLVATDPGGGGSLAFHPVSMGDDLRRELEGLVVLVPVDRRLAE
jgi:hypothetical protein